MPNLLLIPPASGVTSAVITSKVRHILTAGQTGGSLALFEITDAAGSGVPPHIHELEDETLHILEGTYEFFVDGEWMVAGPGTTIFGPRGKAHGFRAVTDARMLVTMTPSGIESMFVELGELAGPPDLAKIAAICDRYQIRFVQPG